jgi:hypothetical protein
MELALLAAAQIDPSRSGISAARDYFSTMMLTKKESTRLPSTPMAGTSSLHQMIQLSRSGILDKDISSIHYMDMKAPQQHAISHHVETISAQLVLILLSWFGKAT